MLPHSTKSYLRVPKRGVGTCLTNSLGYWKSGPMADPGYKRWPFLDNIAPMVQQVFNNCVVSFNYFSVTPPSGLSSNCERDGGNESV